MVIATLHFDHPNASADLDNASLDRLRQSVLSKLTGRFSSFDEAARAQAEHRYVKAHIEDDQTVPLFSMYETFRAAVTANQKALDWEAFIRDANADIAPYCFSIRFSCD